MSIDELAILVSFKTETKIELERLENGDLLIKFNSETIRDLIVKKRETLKEKMGGEARQLLAASLAECMCSTFISLLDWARVDYEGFQADVDVFTGEDDKGRLCVDSIEAKIDVKITEDEETKRKFKRAENLFKRGCFMSRSLKRGIDVRYSVAAQSLHRSSSS